MHYSCFGDRYNKKSGISLLMEDLGNAMQGNNDLAMLGGGNPGHIPEVQKEIRAQMERILANGNEFEHAVGDYVGPQGDSHFISEVASFLRKTFGWNITEKNIALTNGSQTAFFYLFNLFSGKDANGTRKKILLPIVPEYIGYSDLGLDGDIFVSVKPEIREIDEHNFKYYVDFDALEVTDDIGAICLSRPTNPSGNVLTDEEILKLSKLAAEHDIPLIIDNAYGTPFPNIIFTDATPFIDDHVVYCMSLSKFGLPSARTGIVIACEEIITMISELNAVFSLSPGTLGSTLAYHLVSSGKILDLAENAIKPFYEEKMKFACDYLHSNLQGCKYSIHAPEGALFLWLWIKDLPIKNSELYERLKEAGVLVIAGDYFFPGLQEEWQHKYECIRITYAQDNKVVQRGLQIIVETIKELQGII